METRLHYGGWSGPVGVAKKAQNQLPGPDLAWGSVQGARAGTMGPIKLDPSAPPSAGQANLDQPVRPAAGSTRNHNRSRYGYRKYYYGGQADRVPAYPWYRQTEQTRILLPCPGGHWIWDDFPSTLSLSLPPLSPTTRQETAGSIWFASYRQ